MKKRKPLDLLNQINRKAARNKIKLQYFISFINFLIHKSRQRHFLDYDMQLASKMCAAAKLDCVHLQTQVLINSLPLIGC